MIQKLTQADRTLFLTLAAEFYASPAVMHDVPTEYHERTFDELMRAEDYIVCYLIYAGDTPAGYALLQKTFAHEAGGVALWVDEIYIRPAFRGKGLGRELFAFVHALGAPRVRLEVEPENEGAIRLYRALGYTFLPYRSMIRGK